MKCYRLIFAQFKGYYDIPRNEVAVVKVKMQCEYTVTKFYLDELEGQVRVATHFQFTVDSDCEYCSIR